MRHFWLSFKETLEIVLISLVTVFIIRSFLIQPFLVSGASMEPNFSNGNYLIVDEISYYFRNPSRGDVIVFKYPNDPSVFFIKRVIGLPNDRVVIRDGKIFINNQEFKEDYFVSPVFTEGRLDVLLGGDDYFVLGDNRAYSFDSRNWGPVKLKNIIGLARLRILPINEIKAFSYAD